MGVQLVQDDARLGPHPALLGVHLDDVSHVLGEVDDYRAADGLPGQAGAAAPRQHRQPVTARLLHDGDDVVGRLRYHDADGLHLVYAGVGAVQHARHLVEAHLARHASLQVFDQGPYVRICQLSRHGLHPAPGASPDAVLAYPAVRPFGKRRPQGKTTEGVSGVLMLLVNLSYRMVAFNQMGTSERSASTTVTGPANCPQPGL